MKKNLIKIIIGIVLSLTIGGGVFYVTKKNDYVIVPDIVGMQKSYAIDKLKSNNLDADIKEEVVDDEDKIGIVISADEIGEKVKENSKITFVVGVRKQEIKMIKIVDLDIDLATEELEKLGLKINITDKKNDDKEVNKVISQSIKEGEIVQKGDTVDVVISLGKKTTSSSSTTNNNKSTQTTEKTTTTKKVSTWSSWVTSLPSGVTSSKYKIESKDEYRYRDKVFKTSNTPLSGWTKYNEETKLSDWSGEKTTDRNFKKNLYDSDTIKVIKKETMYLYYHYQTWYDNQWNADSIKVDSTSQYCEIELKSELEKIDYPDKGYKKMYGYATGCGHTVRGWFSDGYYYKYTYKERTSVTTYYYYKWDNWSSWSSNKVSESDNRQVEKRTVYRYIAK